MGSPLKRTAALLATLLASVVAVPSCNSWGCDPSPCLPPFHLNGECAVTKNCQLDGELVKSCECCGFTPFCQLWHMPPTGHLTIPLAEFWDELGTRNDLAISRSWRPEGASPDLTKAILLLDGLPPAECERTASEIRCMNVPASAATLDFSYGDPETITDSPILDIFISDQECDDAHPVCPG